MDGSDFNMNNGRFGFVGARIKSKSFMSRWTTGIGALHRVVWGCTVAPCKVHVPLRGSLGSSPMRSGFWGFRVMDNI